MASLPKPDPTPRYLTAVELLAIRDTSKFEVEMRRQMAALDESKRRKGIPEMMELTDEDFPGWV